jgi:chemotaxis protein CheC
MQEIKISSEQKDALQEMANIGAGHASTALSQMVQKNIQMGIPRIELINLEDVSNHIEKGQIVVGIYLRISDEIPSYVMLLIPRDSAFSIADMLLQRQSDPNVEVLSEMDKSALNEVGNVMICAFFDSLSELFQMSVVPGPPKLAYDIPDALIDYILIQIGQVANQVLFFNVDLKEEDKESFRIDMFLLPEPQSVDILLNKLGVK